MKTETAIAHAGSAKALAELLTITPSAISQWGDEVPESRVWQLRVLRPTWFEVVAAPAPTQLTQQPAAKSGAHKSNKG